MGRFANLFEEEENTTQQGRFANLFAEEETSTPEPRFSNLFADEDDDFADLDGAGRSARLAELTRSVDDEFSAIVDENKDRLPSFALGAIKKAGFEGARTQLSEILPDFDVDSIKPKDFDKLTKLREINDKLLEEVSLGDKASHVVGRAVSAVADATGATSRGVGALFSDPLAEFYDGTALSDPVAEEDRPVNLLSEFGGFLQERAERTREATQNEDLVGDFALDTLPTAVGQVVPTIAAGGPVRSALQGATMSGTFLYDEAIDKDVDPETAKIVAILGGLVGLSEAILPTRLFKGMESIPTSMKDKLVRWAIDGQLEGAQEVVQGVAETLILNGFVDEDKREDLFDWAKASHEYGAGATVGTLFSILGGRAATRQLRKLRQEQTAAIPENLTGELENQGATGGGVRQDTNITSELASQEEAVQGISQESDITLQEDADFTSAIDAVTQPDISTELEATTAPSIDTAEGRRALSSQQRAELKESQTNTLTKKQIKETEFNMTPPMQDPFITKKDKTFLNRMGYGWRRLTTKEHGMPKELYEITLDQQGLEKVQAIKSEQIAKNLNDHIEAVGQDSADLKAFFQGEKKLEDLHPDMQLTASKLRDKIENNDRKLRVQKVLPTTRRKLTPEEHLDDLHGRLPVESRTDYTHREYGIFSYKGTGNKNWLKYQDKHDPESITLLREWLATPEGIRYTDRKHNETEMAVVEELARAGTKLYKKVYRQLTGQDRGALKKRNDIPEPIRRFWGENRDVGSIVARTMEVQELLISRDKFHRNLVKLGLEQGWAFEGRKEGYLPLNDQFRYIKGHPLHRISLDPEIKRAIDDPQGMQELSLQEAIDENNETYVTKVSGVLAMQPLSRAVGDVSGAVKGILTIGNPVSHMKNFVSAPVLVWAQGTSGKMLGKGFKAAVAQMRHKFNTKATSLDELELINDLVRYNIADESALGEEAYQSLQQVLKRIEAQTDPGKVDKLLKKIIKGPAETAAALYQLHDTAARSAMFYHEFEVLKKAYPDKGDHELKQEAAMIARNTIPTYSNVPMWTKFFRNKLFGTFMSFNYEIARTFVQTQLRAVHELKSGNRTLQVRGAKRLIASHSLYGTAGVGLSWAAAWAWNSMMSALGENDEISEEENEARSLWRQPWSRASNMLFIDNEWEFDVSNFLPMAVTENFFKKIWEDVGNDELSPKTIYDAAETFLGPYVDTNLGGALYSSFVTKDWEETKKLLVPKLISQPYQLLTTMLKENREDGELRQQLMKTFVGSPSKIDVEKQLIVRDLPDYFTALDIYKGTEEYRKIYDPNASQEEVNAAMLEYARIQERQQQKLIPKIQSIKRLDKAVKLNRLETLEALTNPTKLKGLRGNTDAFFEGSHAVGGRHRLSQDQALALMSGRTEISYPGERSLDNIEERFGVRQFIKVERAILNAQRTLRREARDRGTTDS